MTRLRVGVIGLGVGEQHAHAYRAHGSADVVALCDFDRARLAQVGARFPEARLLAEAGAVLDDPGIDVVSIATYDSHHFEQVRRALAGGKHVFVEKPLCTREQEARELHAVRAANPGVRLSSNLPLRLSPRFRELRERIRAGELGRLYHAEVDYDYGRLWKITDGWRGEEPYYSVMLGGGVHMVDLLLWLTGRRVVRVAAAVGSRVASEGTRFRFDDLVVALLELDDGMVAKVGANFGCVHPHFHAVKLFGTGGTFVNGLGDATLWTGDRRAPAEMRIEAPYPGVGKGDQIGSFLDAILHGGDPVVSEDEVFATMDVLFAIERAHRTGESQTL